LIQKIDGYCRQMLQICRWLLKIDGYCRYRNRGSTVDSRIL
jgi:hypothetical protein